MLVFFLEFPIRFSLSLHLYPVKVGSLYAGRWSRDGLYYRLVYEGNGCVKFVDFGNSSRIEKIEDEEDRQKDFVDSEFYYLEEEFTRPPYAIR